MTELDRVFFASAWFKSRPAKVQAMLHKHPPASPVCVEGVTHYVLGVPEYEDGNCGLYVTPIYPVQDNFEEATAAQITICSCCMKRVHIPTP